MCVSDLHSHQLQRCRAVSALSMCATARCLCARPCTLSLVATARPCAYRQPVYMHGRALLRIKMQSRTPLYWVARDTGSREAALFCCVSELLCSFVLMTLLLHLFLCQEHVSCRLFQIKSDLEVLFLCRGNECTKTESPVLRARLSLKNREVWVLETLKENRVGV